MKIAYALTKKVWLGLVVGAVMPVVLASATVQAETMPEIKLVAKDPAGHGLLATSQGKTILLVDGTPTQMGAAHGALMKQQAQKLVERVVYLIGAADTVHGGRWFFDVLDEIQQRTEPHIPERFLAECDAVADAAGISRRDGRYANLFPERFHCSGIAVRGKATVGGRVLHARVLDYMRDINLQRGAAVVVFMPKGYHTWISLGYAGFVGTVTAMNEKGLAMGEMGGRGEGDWDGLPMTFLMREVMERTATVDEAIELIREVPRTCEYYYVLSDKSGRMVGLKCTPKEMLVLRPGQQHPLLPFVPEEAIIISGPDRAKHISDRIQQWYGKIDVARMIEILRRPVSMQSNLHNAVFAPETLDMWVADAGDHTPACNEPYAHVNLAQLVGFYQKTMSPAKSRENATEDSEQSQGGE